MCVPFSVVLLVGAYVQQRMSELSRAVLADVDRCAERRLSCDSLGEINKAIRRTRRLFRFQNLEPLNVKSPGEAPRPTRTGVVLSFSLNTINHLR